MSKNSVPVIAIDGPSASGKGTVAQQVAQVLGFHFLDSGAIYRLVALAAVRQGVALSDERALAKVAEHLDVRFENGGIWLAGEEVGDALRTEECGNNASKVAAFPLVRTALVARQRAFRCMPGLVADGRDMGSTIFPDANVKIFLTATPQVRADRRYNQLKEKGSCANIQQILQEIEQRDARDAARSVAPLQICADASVLDTTLLTIDEAVSEVLKRYQAQVSR
jgi:cytidylate kinase